MPHAYNKLWIHAIWGTKFRQSFVAEAIERQVHIFLGKQLKSMGCPVRIINGMPDHVHRLFLLNPSKSVAEVMKQLKESSAFYINQEKLLPKKFAWQTGYAAFSVSESVLERVFNYIKYQKRHHLKKSFEDEYQGFIKINGLHGD